MITDPEHLATAVGSRPFLLLGLLVAGAVGSLFALAGVALLADRHARGAWKVAARGWRWFAERSWMQRLERRFPAVWQAVRRLSASEYLLLHLALGLALSVAAIVFVQVAGAVAEGDTVVRVDVALAGALRGATSETGIALLNAFTQLGNGWTIAAFAAVVAVVLLARKRRVMALGWVVAVAGGGALNGLLKSIFARPRPTFEAPLLAASGWSFPSGHAMGTFVTVGMIAYLGMRLARTTPRRLMVVSGAMAWAVTMGFSRMYLGVHYLSDVVAGYAAGTVWLAFCISGLEIAHRRPVVPALDAVPTRPAMAAGAR